MLTRRNILTSPSLKQMIKSGERLQLGRIRWCPLRWMLLAGTCMGELWSQDISRYVNSTAPEAVIEVHPNRRASYRIPRTIYGTFLEHIGQSVFGGISAQLLDNPSLEAYPASPENINRQFPAVAFRQSTQSNLPPPW